MTESVVLPGIGPLRYPDPKVCADCGWEAEQRPNPLGGIIIHPMCVYCRDLSDLRRRRRRRITKNRGFM